MKNSGSHKIAERYVSALFDVASAAKAVDAVENDLKTLAELLKTSEDFRDFIKNPLLTRDQMVQAATAVLSKLNASKLTVQFITLLARAKRLDVLGAVVELFLTMAATARGELAAEVTSAKPLSDAEAGVIADKLAKAYNKKIALKLSVNPALIGGAVITVGSVRLDASLAGKLNRLKSALYAA